MKKIFLKIWKDKVWSKIIATGILFISGAIWNVINGIPVRFIKLLYGKLLIFYEFFINNKSYLIILLLSILLLFLFFIILKLLRQNKQVPNEKKDPNKFSTNWLLNLPPEQFSKYSFLFWFPANRRLTTPHYDRARGSRVWGGVTFEHVPEIRTLINHRVIKYKYENVLYFYIEIDQNVYDFLENVINNTPNKHEKDKNLDVLRSRDFYQLFDGTGFQF